jgi:hypothetical protein
MKSTTFITLLFVAATIIGVFTLILDERTSACTGAIAAIPDKRELALFITANPFCAKYLKPSDWPPYTIHK